MCKPRDLGGLGVVDLRRTGVALSARWEWKCRVDQRLNWSSLHRKKEKMVTAVFKAATVSIVGSGESTFFWTDNWIDGTSIQSMASALFQAVAARRRGRWYVMHYRVMHGCATSPEHIRFRSSTSSCLCGSKFGTFSPCREHLMCFGGGSHRMEPTLRPRLMEPCSLELRGLLGQGRFGRPRRRQEFVPSSGW